MGETSLRNSVRMMWAGAVMTLIGLLHALRAPHESVRAMGVGLTMLGLSLAAVSALTAAYDHMQGQHARQSEEED